MEKYETIFSSSHYSERKNIQLEYISDKRNHIDQQRNTITLQPGHQIRVKVVPRLFTTTNDFNELPQEIEGLSFLKEYTRIGCETECALQKALSVCKCIPWYYPSNIKGLPMCEMFGGHYFEVMMKDTTKQCKAQCLVDCYETAYIIFWSSPPIDLKSTCKPMRVGRQGF